MYAKCPKGHFTDSRGGEASILLITLCMLSERIRVGVTLHCIEGLSSDCCPLSKSNGAHHMLQVQGRRVSNMSDDYVMIKQSAAMEISLFVSKHGQDVVVSEVIKEGE